jgi:tetratricopeptide (TPR) repeat protein
MNDKEKMNIEHLVEAFDAYIECGTVKLWEEKELLLLMDYFAAERQYERSLEICEEGLNSFPYSISFYLKKIIYLLELNSVDQVARLLVHINALFPGNHTVTLLHARLLFKLNNNVEALRLLTTLEGKMDAIKSCEMLLLKANILEEDGQTDEIFPILARAVLLDPKNEEAIEYFWGWIESYKKYEEGIGIFSQLLDVDSYSGLSWYYLGLSHAYLGNYDDALDALEFAFLSTPGLEIAYREYGNLCFELKKFQKALEAYEEMMSLFVSDSEVLMLCGQCCLELNQSQKSLAYFRKALQSDPMNDEVLYNIGEVFLQHNDWKKAILYYKRAIQIEDQREEYYASMGIAYQQLNALDKAEYCFQEAVNLAPCESKYWLYYLSFLIHAARKQEAIELAKAGELETEGSTMIFAHIACLLADGQRKEALRMLGAALEEDYSTHTVLFTLLPDVESDPEVTEMLQYYRPES